MPGLVSYLLIDTSSQHFGYNPARNKLDYVIIENYECVKHTLRTLQKWERIVLHKGTKEDFHMSMQHSYPFSMILFSFILSFFVINWA